MIRDTKLEQDIVKFVASHESDNLDLVDLNFAFPKVDNVLLKDAIVHLRRESSLYKVNIGLHYKYTTIKPESYE